MYFLKLSKVKAIKMGQLTKINHDEWRDRIKNIMQNNVLSSYLEYAKEVFEYQTNCKQFSQTKGGSEFTSNMVEWFGINKDASYQLAIIGSEHEFFLKNITRIPYAHSSLFMLAKLGGDSAQKLLNLKRITYTSTTKDIRSGIDEIENADRNRELKGDRDKAKKANDEAKKAEEEIPSEDLLEDFELAGFDDDGNEIWETKGSGVKEVTVKDEEAEQERVKQIAREEHKKEKIIDKIGAMIRKATMEDAEDALDYMISFMEDQ
jgi:hypothetical protein